MTSELSYHVDGNMASLTSPKAGWQLPICSLAGVFWKLVHLLRVWSLITPKPKCVPGVLVNLWTERQDKGIPVDERHRRDFGENLESGQFGNTLPRSTRSGWKERSPGDARGLLSLGSGAHIWVTKRFCIHERGEERGGVEFEETVIYFLRAGGEDGAAVVPSA